VVLAHPNRQSFNGLIVDTYCETVARHGQEAIVRDLYAIHFDPVLKDAERPGQKAPSLAPDVIAERETIRSSDVFVFVYPIWFGMPPAILKGYIDRVLGAGVTPRDLQKANGPDLLRDRLLVSITTSGASTHWLNQQHQLEGMRTLLGDYLVKGFGMRGFEDLHFGETVEGLSQDFIDALVGRVEDFADGICQNAADQRSPDKDLGGE
jgi:NAD(P)H dehydrogenase (quinone)